MGCDSVGLCSVPNNRRVAGSNLPEATAYSDLGQVAHP